MIKARRGGIVLLLWLGLHPQAALAIPPVNDACSEAIVIDPAAGLTRFSLTTEATSAGSDPSPACAPGREGKNVWFRIRPPSDGILSLSTAASNYDTVLSVYSTPCGSRDPASVACNDDVSDEDTSSALMVAVTAGQSYLIMVSAYHDDGGTLRFQAEFDAGPTPTASRTPTRTRTPSRTASATATRTPTASRTATTTPTPAHTATTTASRTATVTTTQTPTQTATGTATAGEPPANDTCAQAQEIATAPHSEVRSTAAANLEADAAVPPCGGGRAGKSVWYRFAAAANGRLTVDTFGSGYDTILSAHTGACPSPQAVAGACNDDIPGMQRTSRVSFDVVAGTTYLLLVTAFENDGGELHLQLSFDGSATPTPTSSPTSLPTPHGDQCDDAVAVGALPFSHTANTAGATISPGDPVASCEGAKRARSFWYALTAPHAGTFTAETLGSSYDTILSVHSGSCADPTQLPSACNDDIAGGGTTSRVSFAAAAGQSYLFLIRSFTNAGGNLHFALFAGEPTPRPTPTATAVPCPGDCNGDGAATQEEVAHVVEILALCPCDLGTGGAAFGCEAIGGLDTECTEADGNGDGCISAGELTRMLANAAAHPPTGCPPPP